MFASCQKNVLYSHLSICTPSLLNALTRLPATTLHRQSTFGAGSLFAP